LVSYVAQQWHFLLFGLSALFAFCERNLLVGTPDSMGIDCKEIVVKVKMGSTFVMWLVYPVRYLA
jgi:hypothetical protein